MDDLELQVRVPMADDDSEWLESLDDMVEAFGEALDGADAGYIDDAEGELEEICFYLYGSDQDALARIARSVLVQFGRLDGAYSVKTAPGNEESGEGVRVEL